MLAACGGPLQRLLRCYSHVALAPCTQAPVSPPRSCRLQARILVHGKVTHLGYYETEEEAARVYDK